MRCRACRSKATRVTVTEQKRDETWRYQRCLDCGARFKTVEVYAVKKPGVPTGTKAIRHNHPKGVNHPSCVLLENDVHEIRRLSRAGVSHTLIAKQFGLSRAYVGKIAAYKAWAHLDSPDDLFG